MRDHTRVLSALADADPETMTAARADLEGRARALLGDEAWWTAMLPSYAKALEPLFDTYGTVVSYWAAPGDWREVAVRAADHWRDDDVVTELVVGMAARLSVSPDPSAQLVGLKARRWLGWWRADVRRQRSAMEVLGIAEPAPTFPGVLVFPLVVAPPSELAEPEAVAPELSSGWVRRAAVLAALGVQPVPLPSWGQSPVRPWLWCWELEHMPARALQWADDGNPVPLPVVVPCDFDPDVMPDRYGFAADATPGETLVVDDPDRVLDAWSGHLTHHGPIRGLGQRPATGPTVWRRGRPVPMTADDVRPVVEHAAPEPVAPVVVLRAPVAEPEPEEPSLASRLAAQDAERAEALRRVDERFDPWRGR